MIQIGVIYGLCDLVANLVTNLVYSVRFQGQSWKISQNLDGTLINGTLKMVPNVKKSQYFIPIVYIYTSLPCIFHAYIVCIYMERFKPKYCVARCLNTCSTSLKVKV